MKRYFVRLEGEIVVLDSDIKEQDYIDAGFDREDDVYTEYQLHEVVEIAANRMIRPTGFDVQDGEVIRVD